MGSEYTRSLKMFSSRLDPEEVLLHDDFSKGVDVALNGTSQGGADQSTDYLIDNSETCKLYTVADTPENTDIVRLERSFPMSPLRYCKFQAHFLAPDVSDLKEIVFYLEYDNSVNLVYYAVKYDVNTGLFYYQDSVGDYIAMSDTTYSLFDGYWYRISLLFDNVNRKYIKFIFNDVEFDLSGIPAYSQPTNDLHYSILCCQTQVAVDQQAIIYLGTLSVLKITE